MSGKLALVTGGNRGIGLDVSRRLLKSGDRVLLASRNLSDGQAAAQKLEAEIPGASGRVAPIELDVSQDSSIQRLVELVREQYPGKIDILVNNAGIFPTAWNQELWDKVMKTNIWGPMMLTEALIPLLAPGANILNVSSSLGRYALLHGRYADEIPTAKTIEDLKKMSFDPNSKQGTAESWPTYTVSKAVMNRYTQLLAKDPEVVKRGIKVNSVHPGWCSTDMGGPTAVRTPEQGGESVFLATKVQETGKFYLDGSEIDW